MHKKNGETKKRFLQVANAHNRGSLHYKKNEKEVIVQIVGQLIKMIISELDNINRVREERSVKTVTVNVEKHFNFNGNVGQFINNVEKMEDE